MCGQGVKKLSDGTIYSGQFHNDTMNGKGIIKLPDGGSYEGDFLNGFIDGHGQYYYQNGDV